jgi:hypothetical protein
MKHIFKKMAGLYNSAEGLWLTYCLNVVILAIVYATPVFKETMNYCAVKLPDSTHSFTHDWRGRNYLLNQADKTASDCFLTRWNVAHFVSYVFCGFCCPKWKWFSIVIGILFEVLEWVIAECQDVTDIVVNSLGCLTGAKLSQWII